MPENWIILIPIDPGYMPETSAQKQALDLFDSCAPLADEVTATLTDTIQFIAQGGNFESVFCSACGAKLDIDWWSAAVDTAFEGDGFSQASLLTTVPCWGADVSLNDLRYDWPAGFARFALSARNPNIFGIADDKVTALERVLGCSLRTIWAHW